MTKMTEFNVDDYGDEPVMYQDMDHFLLEREQRIRKSRDQRKELTMRSEDGRHRTQEYCNQRMTETSRYLRKIVECENDMRSDNSLQQNKRFGDIIDRIEFSYKPKFVGHDSTKAMAERVQNYEKDESKETTSLSPSHSQNSLNESTDDYEKKVMKESFYSDEDDKKSKSESETGSSSGEEVVEKKTSINDEDRVNDKEGDDEDDGTISRNDKEDVKMLKEEVKNLRSENKSLQTKNKELEEELETLRNRLRAKEEDGDKSDVST